MENNKICEMAWKRYQKEKIGGIGTMRIRNIINQVTYYRKKYGMKKTIKKIISKTQKKL